MKQVFENATYEGKKAILEFLSEIKKSVMIRSNEISIDYFRQTHPEFFKEIKLGERFFLGSFLLTKEGHISFSGSIQMVSDGKVFVNIQEYFSGDAESYKDSCYQTWKSMNHPNGIVLSIPIENIEKISVLN